MTTAFLLGVLVFPVLALLVFLALLARDFVSNRLIRIKAGNPELRAKTAGILFASKRAFVLWCQPISVAVMVGHNWATRQQAEAVLLDEFVPMTNEAKKEGE